MNEFDNRIASVPRAVAGGSLRNLNCLSRALINKGSAGSKNRAPDPLAIARGTDTTGHFPVNSVVSSTKQRPLSAGSSDYSPIACCCEAIYQVLSNGSLIEPTRAPWDCNFGGSFTVTPSASEARANHASTSSTYIMKTAARDCHCSWASPISTIDVPIFISACRTLPSGDLWTDSSSAANACFKKSIICGAPRGLKKGIRLGTPVGT